MARPPFYLTDLRVAKTIRLRVTHPEKEPGPIEGLLSLWAFYVRGFNPKVHCQRCFRGARASNFKTRNARSGTAILFDRMDVFPYVYICAVGAGKKEERGRTNLHFPLRYEAGAVADRITYNGYRFVAENAVASPIPEPPVEWKGLAPEHYRCKNFRFGVAYFALPEQPGSEAQRPGSAR
jgi:hypothetical protein